MTTCGGFVHDKASRAGRKCWLRARLGAPHRYRKTLVTALPPDITLVIEQRPGYLYAGVSGPRDSQAISIAYWTLVAEQCRLRKVSKLLVFENLGENEDELDVPAVVDAIFALGMEHIQIAFVAGRTEMIASMEYGGILAAERGLKGRVFGSLSEAERWLRYGAH